MQVWNNHPAAKAFVDSEPYSVTYLYYLGLSNNSLIEEELNAFLPKYP